MSSISQGPNPRAKRFERAIIGSAIIAHAGLTAWLALARYASAHNRTFDLALYARMTWGLAHGEAWDPIVGGSVLGGHLPWVLLPLALLSRFLPTVPLLLCVQSLALALAAWPLACFAARRLGSAGAIVAALVWLLQPNLGHVASYEFHPGSLAVLPMCFAFDALERAEPRGFMRASMAVLACRVSLALQTALLGLVALTANPRLRRAGRALVLGSLGYLLVSQLWLQPHFGRAAQSSLDLHFGKWGGSPFGVLPALWRAPASVGAHFCAPERVRYPLLVLAPFGFLPLFAPRYLWLALPPIAINLVSEFPTATQLYSHYLTPALPALAFGAIEGLCRISALMRRLWPAFGLAWLGIAASIGNAVGSGLPWARDVERGAFASDAGTLHAQAVLNLIGAEASVQAPDPLLPHLAERRLVTRMPPPERGTDFVVLDLAHRRRYAQQETLLRTTEEPYVRAFLARRDYGAIAAAGDWLVLRRGVPPRSGLARAYLIGVAPPGPAQALSACLELRTAVLRGRQLVLELSAKRACAADVALRFGAQPDPSRVDLLFDGLLSPAQLQAGDLLRSTHALSPEERVAILRRGLRIGLVRSSGARPEPNDPLGLELQVRLEQ